jgi:hypothetical protein
MIDKSIRQHYANGKIVDPFIEGMQKIWRSPTAQKLKPANIGQNLRQTYFPQNEGRLDKTQLAKNVGSQFLTNFATKKALSGIMGTGALSFLGPLAPFVAMFLANKGITKGKDYLAQGFQPPGLPSLFRAPGQTQAQWEADRQLGQLQKRKEYMWDRMLKDKPYSEKNLIDVINQIAKKTGAVDADDMGIDLTPKVIPKTPEIISPHLDREKTTTTPTTITRDVGLGDAGIAEQIAAQDRAAAAQAAAARAAAAQAVNRHRGQDAGGGGGGAPTGVGNPMGYRAHGGRVDKALGGRIRDIG